MTHDRVDLLDVVSIELMPPVDDLSPVFFLSKYSTSDKSSGVSSVSMACQALQAAFYFLYTNWRCSLQEDCEPTHTQRLLTETTTTTTLDVALAAGMFGWIGVWFKFGRSECVLENLDRLNVLVCYTFTGDNHTRSRSRKPSDNIDRMH